jgi:hypothetical protein
MIIIACSEMMIAARTSVATLVSEESLERIDEAWAEECKFDEKSKRKQLTPVFESSRLNCIH